MPGKKGGGGRVNFAYFNIAPTYNRRRLAIREWYLLNRMRYICGIVHKEIRSHPFSRVTSLTGT